MTICHTGTPDIGRHTREADIVVIAAGRPNTLTADMVREGAVVIDVGTNRIDDPSRKRGWRLVGDSDFPALKEKASWITPVPGGVGPMTIAMLLVNTVRAAEAAADQVGSAISRPSIREKWRMFRVTIGDLDSSAAAAISRSGIARVSPIAARRAPCSAAIAAVRCVTGNTDMFSKSWSVENALSRRDPRSRARKRSRH